MCPTLNVNHTSSRSRARSGSVRTRGTLAASAEFIGRVFLTLFFWENVTALEDQGLLAGSINADEVEKMGWQLGDIVFKNHIGLAAAWPSPAMGMLVGSSLSPRQGPRLEAAAPRPRPGQQARAGLLTVKEMTSMPLSEVLR